MIQAMAHGLPGFTAAQAAQKLTTSQPAQAGSFTAAQAAQKGTRKAPAPNGPFTAAQAAQKYAMFLR